jgi:hypothetical protein
MSVKTVAMDAIKRVGDSATRKARALVSKKKAAAKGAALVLIGEFSTDALKTVSDLKDKLHKAIEAVRVSTSQEVDQRIEQYKAEALQKIEQKSAAAIGRLKLISEEFGNTSVNPASGEFVNAAENRIRSIVASASARLDTNQAALVSEFASKTIGGMRDKVAAGFVSEIDITGAVEDSISGRASAAQSKALQAAGEAIIEAAEKEARKVDFESVVPAIDIPPELKKKSTKALRAILKNMEQGDYRTRWTPEQVAAVLSTR